MNYLVDPQTLVFNSHRVNGFTKMVGDENIPFWDLLEVATDVAEEWTEDWDEEEGFGSSDMTFMIKSFIDEVIWRHTSRKFMTKFTPGLSVVEYSEADHHAAVESMEIGGQDMIVKTSAAVHKLLDAYERALNAGDTYVAQLYLEAAGREMNKEK